MRVLVGRREDALERRLAAVGAAALLDVGDELLAPLLQVARDRGDGEIAQRAETLGAGTRAGVDAEAAGRADLLAEAPRADRLEQLDVGELAVAPLELLEDLHHPA